MVRQRVDDGVGLANLTSGEIHNSDPRHHAKLLGDLPVAIWPELNLRNR